MIVVDNEFKRMTGFIKTDELSKWLDDLLRYYDAKYVQSNLKLRKYWVNLMLIKNYSVYVNNFFEKDLIFWYICFTKGLLIQLTLISY